MSTGPGTARPKAMTPGNGIVSVTFALLRGISGCKAREHNVKCSHFIFILKCNLGTHIAREEATASADE
jgi:hypothetical protein